MAKSMKDHSLTELINHLSLNVKLWDYEYGSEKQVIGEHEFRTALIKAIMEKENEMFVEALKKKVVEKI
jgi:hypothetical protein